MFYRHVFCCSYFHPEWSLSIVFSYIRPKVVRYQCDETYNGTPSATCGYDAEWQMMSDLSCLTSLKRCNRHRPRTGNTWPWAVAARNVLEHFPSSLLQHPKPQSLHRKVGCQAWGSRMLLGFTVSSFRLIAG